MKQFKFVPMVAAVFAVITLLSSCSKSDEEKELAVVTVADELSSIIASSNAEVTYTIDVPATAKPSSDKKVALFTGIAKDTKIAKVTATLVNPDGYKSASQTATVRFSKKINTVHVSFTFNKISTDTKPQGDTTNEIVLSATLGEIEAQLIIPAGTKVISGNTVDDFSLSAYRTAPNIIDSDNLKPGSQMSSDGENIVLVMDCTPDGATFSNPVILRVKLGKELAGKTFTIENNGDKVSGTVQADGYAEFKVNHFSPWELPFHVDYVNGTEGTKTLYEKSGVPIYPGTNTFTYTKTTGTETDVDIEAILFLIHYYMGSEATAQTVEGSFTSTASGTASIKVVQHYLDLRFGIEGTDYTARWWGTAETFVTVDGSENNGHSGGSGK